MRQFLFPTVPLKASFFVSRSVSNAFRVPRVSLAPRGTPGDARDRGIGGRSNASERRAGERKDPRPHFSLAPALVMGGCMHVVPETLVGQRVVGDFNIRRKRTSKSVRRVKTVG